MNKLLTRYLVLLPLLLLANAQPLKANEQNIEIKPFIAKYKVFRSGEEHGTAERELFALDSMYRLSYKSSISWMIFSDERSEASEFKVVNNQIQPFEYKMKRSGTGPDRSYHVTFNRQDEKIELPKKRKKRKNRKPKHVTHWNSLWLDPISYQQQLYIDLKRGKKQFNYSFINRKGQEQEYLFRVAGEEPLVLPYGTIKAIKVERYYETQSERQTIAWFAPELDYALVRIWKGKSGVEQFDIQLSELKK